MIRNDFICLSSASAFGVQENFFSYSTADTSTTVADHGYFDEVAQILQIGDLVQVKCADKNEILQFTTEKGVVPVVTAPFDTGGGGDLTPIAADHILANPTAGTALPVGTPLGITMSLSGGELNALGVLSAIASNYIIANPSGVSALPIGIAVGNGLGITGSVLGLESIATLTLLGNLGLGNAIPTAMNVGSGFTITGGNTLNAVGSGSSSFSWAEIPSATQVVGVANTGYHFPLGSLPLYNGDILMPSSVTVGNAIKYFAGNVGSLRETAFRLPVGHILYADSGGPTVGQTTSGGTFTFTGVGSCSLEYVATNSWVLTSLSAPGSGPPVLSFN